MQNAPPVSTQMRPTAKQQQYLQKLAFAQKASSPKTVDEVATLMGKKLRNGQKDCVEKLLQGYSVLISLTTGKGKSLCYQLFTKCKNTDGFIIFVAPLTCILQQQAVVCTALEVSIFF